ncbi:MAG: hypothetical protein ACP5G5_06300 [Thermoplasmata archaeon]|jgi:hypothetical protein|nr:hypothetical protein [Thermoplasmatales archaeon]PMP75915.1 MAG: hypothetical protein C0180_00060 [Aciduliprofundum sp.]HEU13224.1 hypothetical protein [Euryarchaeota archaeon]
MFPDEVITISKKGKREVRNLVGKGRFVLYNYLNPENGMDEEKKKRLVLRFGDGHTEEYFIIPTSDGKRNLLINAAEKEGRKIWDGKRAVDLEELLVD